VTIGPDEIRFADNARPGLTAGEYRLEVRQHVKLPDQWESPEPYVSEQRMRVAGPHFVLGPEDVVSVYPPAQAFGDFSSGVCHAVLRRRTLPWEIALERGGDGPVRAPWLAILLLTPDEIQARNGGGAGDRPDEVTGMFSVPLAQYLTPEPGVLGPVVDDEQRRRWLAEFPDLQAGVVDVVAGAFTAVAPLAADLPFLAHVREVNTSAQEQPPADAGDDPQDADQGRFAVVLGNRLPQGSESGLYLAHLVSLEGFVGYLADRQGVPPGHRAVRLLSLARWAFTSDRAPDARYFADLLTGLDAGVLALPGPSPDSEPPAPDLTAPDWPEPVERAIGLGYVPADYRTRLGERTMAWYRGPLLPRLMERNMQPMYPAAEAALVYDRHTGIFDVSLAVAWQAGRLLALADRTFTSGLLAWIRDHHELAQLLLERIELFQNYDLLGPGDLLTEKLPARFVRRVLAQTVATRLTDEAAPLLGPALDPSGLLRHRHRLPGLLTSAEVDELLRSGQDPHLAVRLKGGRP
jgi:hypothetical protein